MSKRVLVYSLVLVALSAFPCFGGLLISEVLFNEVSSDVTGEWIEIFNNGSAPIDLSNYKIGDEETMGGTTTTEAMQQFPAGASIAPHEVQIVSVSATKFLSLYGFLPNYEATATDATVPDLLPYPTWDPDGGAFNMANGGDQALILGPMDEHVDAVSWGSSAFAFNPPLGTALDGQSYERINPFVDTDTATDWRAVADSSVPAVERSTPGTVPVPEPAGVVIALIAICASTFTRNRS
ncbi:MAG TPA: lamin tail domain-containing protein [Lacipirellulaceae bacterium]|nr:lamin tail domain-containing protein [Lacipirellulaceae bacterium]